MKNYAHTPEITFSHFVFEENDTFFIDAAQRNYIIFFLKGRALSGDKKYSTGDIAFFPSSFDFTVKFTMPGDVLSLSFDNTPDVFKEIQKLLVVKDSSGYDESLGYLKIKYPMNIYAMLTVRYIEDKVLTPSLAFYKLAELFAIFNKYYDEREIRDLFLPIVSSSPSFKLLVYSKFNFQYNVDQLADSCKMSRRTFERKFNKVFNGVTPSEWIQKLKTRKIYYKLSLPGASIKDVMSEFNFYDSSHFNKFCKQYFNMPPRKLIKSIRQSQNE